MIFWNNSGVDVLGQRCHTWSDQERLSRYMPNHLIAYLLIALLVLGVAGMIAWNVHNSRERVIARRRRREREYRERRSSGSDDMA